MDPKSLAKSKRAHSQHHTKKFHSNQKPKPPSDAKIEAESSNKLLGKQIKDKNLQSQSYSAKLPSNFDRYDEELSNEAITPASDIVLPKSKGADYRNLVAEAQSQNQTFTYMDVFPSLDDVFSRELSSGGSAMAAIRGESILSWIRDDSFVVEEKTTANPEAPFLSLNLHTLAEQLEKIDLAERLFIEEDILPTELLGKGKVARDQQFSLIQTLGLQEGTVNSEKSHNSEFYEEDNIGDSVRNVKAASPGTSIRQDSTLNPSPISLNQVNNVDPKYAEQLNTNIVSKKVKKTTTFVAAAAEEELDMLLSSFSETIDLNDSVTASNTPGFDDVFKASPHLPSRGTDLVNKAPVAAELDDALDDLLQETSNLTSHKEKSVHSNIQSLSPVSETKSILKDDFDSWLDTI